MYVMTNEKRCLGACGILCMDHILQEDSQTVRGIGLCAAKQVVTRVHSGPE